MSGPRVLTLQRGQYGFMFTISDVGGPYDLPAPVSKVSADGPAHRGGLRQGDGIIAVNGQPIRGKSHLQVANMIRASSGRVLELLVTEDTQCPLEYLEQISLEHLDQRPIVRRRNSETCSVPAYTRERWRPNDPAVQPDDASDTFSIASTSINSTTSNPRVIRREAYASPSRSVISPRSTLNLNTCRSATDLQSSYVSRGTSNLHVSTQPRIRFRPGRYSTANTGLQGSTGGSNSKLHRLTERNSNSPSNEYLNTTNLSGSQLSISGDSSHTPPLTSASHHDISSHQRTPRLRLNRVGGLILPLAPLSTDEIADDPELGPLSPLEPLPISLPLDSTRPLPLHSQHTVFRSNTSAAPGSRPIQRYNLPTVATTVATTQLPHSHPCRATSFSQLSNHQQQFISPTHSNHTIGDGQHSYHSDNSVHPPSNSHHSNQTTILSHSNEGISNQEENVPRGIPLSRLGMVNLRSDTALKEMSIRTEPAVSLRREVSNMRAPRPLGYLEVSPPTPIEEQSLHSGDLCAMCRHSLSSCSCRNSADDQTLFRRESFFHAVQHGQVDIPAKHRSSHDNTLHLVINTTDSMTSSKCDDVGQLLVPPDDGGHSTSPSPGLTASQEIRTEDGEGGKNTRNFRKLKHFFGENSKSKAKTIDGERATKTPKIQEAVRNPLIPVSSAVSAKILLLDGKLVKSSWKQFLLSVDEDHILLTRDKSLPGPLSHSVEESALVSLPLKSCSVEEDIPDSTQYISTRHRHRKHVVKVTRSDEFRALLQFPNSASLEHWCPLMHNDLQSQTFDSGSTDTAFTGSLNSNLISASSTPNNPPKRAHKLGKGLTNTSEDDLNANASKGKLQQAISKMKTKNLRPKKIGDTTSASADFERQKEEWFSRSKTITVDDPTSVFGAPLFRCPRSSCSPFIPLVVELCVRLVEAFGINSVGIYRVSGNKHSIDQLCSQLSQLHTKIFVEGVDSIDPDHSAWTDINAVAGVLRCFLRSLPDPLFPKALYNSFMHAYKAEPNDPPRRLLRIQRVLAEMACGGLPAAPSCRPLQTGSTVPVWATGVHAEWRNQRETLRFLAGHLYRISVNSQTNKMDSHNLAVIFAPNLIQSFEDTPSVLMTDSGHRIQLLEDVIRHHEWIFSSDPPSWTNTSSNGISTDLIDDSISSDISPSIPADNKSLPESPSDLIRQLMSSAGTCQSQSAPSPTVAETSLALSELSRLIAQEEEGDSQTFGEVDIDEAVNLRQRADHVTGKRPGIRHRSSIERPPSDLLAGLSHDLSPTSALSGLRQLSVDCLVTYEAETRELSERAEANQRERLETQRQRSRVEEQLKAMQSELARDKQLLDKLTESKSQLRKRWDPGSIPLRRRKYSGGTSPGCPSSPYIPTSGSGEHPLADIWKEKENVRRPSPDQEHDDEPEEQEDKEPGHPRVKRRHTWTPSGSTYSGVGSRRRGDVQRSSCRWANEVVPSERRNGAPISSETKTATCFQTSSSSKAIDLDLTNRHRKPKSPPLDLLRPLQLNSPTVTHSAI